MTKNNTKTTSANNCFVTLPKHVPDMLISIFFHLIRQECLENINFIKPASSSSLHDLLARRGLVGLMRLNYNFNNIVFHTCKITLPKLQVRMLHEQLMKRTCYTIVEHVLTILFSSFEYVQLKTLYRKLAIRFFKNSLPVSMIFN